MKTWSIAGALDGLRKLEKLTRPPKLGHDVDVPLAVSPDGYYGFAEPNLGADALADREAEEDVAEAKMFDAQSLADQVQAERVEKLAGYSSYSVKVEDGQPYVIGSDVTLGELHKCTEPTCCCQDDDRYQGGTCPAGKGKCPTDCDRTQQGCVQTWGPDAEHLEASQRNHSEPACCGITATHIHVDPPSHTHESEVCRAHLKDDCGICDDDNDDLWAHPRDLTFEDLGIRIPAGPPGSTEPALTDDELVGIRGLIQERYGDTQRQYADAAEDSTRTIFGIPRHRQPHPNECHNDNHDPGCQCGALNDYDPGRPADPHSNLSPAAFTPGAGDTADDCVTPPAQSSAIPNGPAEVVGDPPHPSAASAGPLDLTRWTDATLMLHASNCILDHRKLKPDSKILDVTIDELRRRAHQLNDISNRK